VAYLFFNYKVVA